jgi:hypothetical protein
MAPGSASTPGPVRRHWRRANADPHAGGGVHVWQCYEGLTQQSWVFNGVLEADTRKVGPIKLRDVGA